MDKVKLAVNSSGEIINCDEARFGMMTHVKYQEELKQARNEALEEAAKVAEFCLEINAIKSFEVMNFTLANFVGGHISKAIRALKEK